MTTICIAPQGITRHRGPSPAAGPIPACDRCYSIKVKCVPSNTFKGCCRCFRLQHQCSYSRRRGLPGRKKKRQDLGVSPARLEYRWIGGTTTTTQETGRSVTSSDEENSQSGEDDSYANILRSAVLTAPHPRQYNSIDSDTAMFLWQDQMAWFYAVSTCFAPVLSAKVQGIICRGPPLLRDLYLALRRVMRRVETGQTEHERSDVLTSSLGLQVLRDTRIHDHDSLVSFLWLGIFLKSFDRLVLGTSTHLICESTLLQLRTWYSSVSSDPEILDPMVCLLFTDTVTSLVNRQVPIIKFEPPRPGLIDRYAGLCCDLLPILYETCEVVAAGKHADGVLDIVAWEDVYQRVQTWEPQCPPDMLATFTSDELTTLLTQAHAYRLCTLLTLNRARYGFDAEAPVQVQLAEEILSQMETCLVVVGEPAPHTMLPVFVAALELTDVERRLRALQILRCCRGANYYPYMARLGEMCHEFWGQKDAEGSADWLTFLHRYHPLNIPL